MREKISADQGFEPGAAGGELQTQPLCNPAPRQISVVWGSNPPYEAKIA